MKTFGAYVRARRQRCGQTQEMFAESLGIDRSYLSRIETGEAHDLSYSLVRRLASELALTLDEVDGLLYAGQQPERREAIA